RDLLRPPAAGDAGPGLGSAPPPSRGSGGWACAAARRPSFWQHWGVNVSAPTTVVLYKARLIFTLTALLPTLLMAGLGIILVAEGGSKSVALVGGILVLAFCGTALAGWALGTILVNRG